MFDAYKIGITLSLKNHVTAGLLSIARDFTKTEAEAKAFENRLKSIKRTALAGGIMAGAGFGMLALFKGPLDEAKKFQTEVAKFTALGLGDQVNRDAVQFAKGMDTIGLSARDNMKMLREATAIMGDFSHAKEVLPMLAQMHFGIESVMGGGGGDKFDQMFQSALKTTELRGALINRDTGQIDIDKFSSALNMMTQAYVASGGRVTPNDYLAAIKTGGVSTKLMNDEMFYFGLGHFMQESGGSRTGTAAMSMFQNLAMGRVSKMVARNLADIGVIKQSDIRFGMGPMAAINPMSIKNAKGFTDNPFKWINETLVPLLKAKGLSGNDLNIKLAQMFGIRTAANLADQFVREEKIADLYIERAKKAANVDQLQNIGKNTLLGKQIELQKNWENLQLELGETILPMAISALKKLNPMLKEMTDWMKENPGTVKVLTYSFIGLGVALAGLGSLAVIAAGFNAIRLALSLFSATSIIGSMTKVIGSSAFELAIAGALGYAIGTLLNHVIDGLIQHFTGGKESSLGGWIFGLTHKDPDFSAPIPPRPTTASQPVIHNHFHVDSKEIAHVLVPSKPLGPTGINSGAQPLPFGMNSSWAFP